MNYILKFSFVEERQHNTGWWRSGFLLREGDATRMPNAADNLLLASSLKISKKATKQKDLPPNVWTKAPI